MKRRFTWPALLLASSVLLCGCAPVDSFFPLYKPEDKAFEPELIGVWKIPDKDAKNKDDKDSRWTFRGSADQNFYDFKWGIVRAKGGLLAKVRLVRLDSALFIDFEGDSENKALNSKNTLMPFPIVAVHMMGRIWLEGDTLRIHFLKDDWVDDQIKAGSFPLAHVGSGGNTLLTASTDELRKFMLDHADDSEALSDNYTFQRTK